MKQSQGRLSQIFAIVSIPTFISLGIGFWISQETLQDQKEESRKEARHEISVQAETLVQLLSKEIELIRAEAREFALKTNEPGNSISGRILHWSDLTIQSDGTLRVKRIARNLLWNANSNLESTYLHSVGSTLNMDEVFSNGMGLFRVKKDPGGQSEWMGFAFPSPLSEKELLLVLMEPQQAFPLFQRWADLRQDGKTRGYLLGRDGKVLLHSQPTLISSDFRGVSLFQEQLRTAFSGSWTGGNAQYTAFDQAPVRAAYYRVGSLPVVSVVEEVISEAQEGTGQNWTAFLQYSFLGMVFQMGLALACTFFLKKRLTQVVSVPVQVPVVVQSSEDVSPSQPLPTLPSEKFFEGNELLILETPRSQGYKDL